MTRKTAVFTIVSLNYTAFARTLMESVGRVHPEWDRHVLLVDRCDDPSGVGGTLFSTLTVEELPLPCLRQFLFRYGITELNTAVKPWMFAHLRSRGYEQIVFLDPDILVVARLVDVEQALDDGAWAVVTPHLTAPIDDGRRPTELEIMQCGAYNLGFLAIAGASGAGAGADRPAADRFIRWWQEKLEFGAVMDKARGLFTDQKWIDLAPGMFGGVTILRDAGYNVAYWNLSHRPISRNSDAWLAAGRPLRFFHFSGFNPEAPGAFSKHQDRFAIDTIGPARELALDYAGRVLGHGHAQFRTRRYAFDCFEDGTPIESAIRELYREDVDLRDRAGEDPFANTQVLVQGTAGGLPTILRALWLKHEHLQRIFPDPSGSSREFLYRWFVEAGAVEFGISDAYAVPVRRELSEYLSARDRVPNDPAQVLPGGSIWARILVFLHRRATGRTVSAGRMLLYRQVSGPIAFLHLVLGRFRRPRRSTPVAHAPDPAAARIASARDFRPRRMPHYWGLYAEPGQEVWWMGKEARFLIDPTPGTILRVRGVHHAQMHRLAHGRPELDIHVLIDDEPRGVVKIANPGGFDIAIELGEIGSDRPAVLRLVPSACFVPGDIGPGGDNRSLSVQIAAIDFGDTSVFDAAHPLAANAVALLGTPGVNVIGYARSEIGIGQSLRLFVAALDAAKIPAQIIDFTTGNLNRAGDRSLDERIASEPAHGINVFHINADQMPVAEMHLPSHFFARFNIGFWHWELPEMPDEHLAGFHRLDEIWVPTAFVQDAVSKKSPVPVVRMPHAIRFSPSPGASRQRFGLPENRFLFLMMYDFSSYQERKNPGAVLEAFERAFPDNDSGAALVIKTQNAQLHPTERDTLRERLADRDNVVWLDETLSRQDVYDLQSVCDALVSLHRSEGFGLGPAEAMFLGKPVIATNWSGNTEFMHPDNSLPVNYRLMRIERDIGVYRAGQTWADPDIEHAAWLMQRVVDDEALRARISREAARTMRDEYSPEVIGRRIRARLEFIQSTLIGG